MARIAVNGLGRMGKLLLRRFFDEERGSEVALLNKPFADIMQHAMLLEFDTVHGRRDLGIEARGDHLSVSGHAMRFTQAKEIRDLPLQELGIDLVIDCTGVHKSAAKLQPYLDAGVRKVVVSAPAKDKGILNLVYGANHDLYDPHVHDIVTAASCTTNCLAPIVKVLHEKIRIKYGSITIIHDATNTQNIVDKVHKDPRRARSALNSLIPTSTGSTTAITLIYPELEGRLNGHAVRVPLLNASLVDSVFEMARETYVEEVNALFAESATSDLKGILGYEERPLVSCDFLNDPRSSIVDGPSTMVINGTQVKIFAWYDNEWGYVCRMADIAAMVAAGIQ